MTTQSQLMSKGLPYFEPATCQFKNSYTYDVECGFLIVPEDRSQLDGSTVRLHVAIFKSTNPTPDPDPVIYLAGGGGVNHLDSSGYYLNNGGYEILQQRDYIMYNQRGAHYNKPSLDCPGFSDHLLNLAGKGFIGEKFHSQKLDFLLSCRDELLDRGINLDVYNSAINAADLNDLRLVLGYDKVNLYGTSYGTRVALTMMRDFPESVRSVILDSVYPPQVDYFSEYGINAYEAYIKLFKSCDTDLYCQKTYPDLEKIFYQVIDNLNDNHASMTWMNSTIKFDGGIFSEAVYLMLYTAEIGLVPKAIYEASKDDFSILEPYILGTLDITVTSINWGAYYSIHCSEEALLDSFDHAEELSSDLPEQLQNYYTFNGPNSASFNFSLCESWGAKPVDPVENKPIISDIPALILAGQFDPITPSEWGRLASETLENSFYYEFPGHGHGIMRTNQCALEIGIQFLGNPIVEPDTTCISTLPDPDFQ